MSYSDRVRGTSNATVEIRILHLNKNRRRWHVACLQFVTHLMVRLSWSALLLLVDTHQEERQFQLYVLYLTTEYLKESNFQNIKWIVSSCDVGTLEDPPTCKKLVIQVRAQSPLLCSHLGCSFPDSLFWTSLIPCWIPFLFLGRKSKQACWSRLSICTPGLSVWEIFLARALLPIQSALFWT